MEHHQHVRIVAIVALTVGYVAHKALNGGDPLLAFGRELSPFVALVAGIIALASPETLEYLPFGPTRKS